MPKNTTINFFEDIAGELRNLIYGYICAGDKIDIATPIPPNPGCERCFCGGKLLVEGNKVDRKTIPRTLLVSRQFHEEAEAILYHKKTFFLDVEPYGNSDCQEKHFDKTKEGLEYLKQAPRGVLDSIENLEIRVWFRRTISGFRRASTMYTIEQPEEDSVDLPELEIYVQMLEELNLRSLRKFVITPITIHESSLSPDTGPSSGINDSNTPPTNLDQGAVEELVGYIFALSNLTQCPDFEIQLSPFCVQAQDNDSAVWDRVLANILNKGEEGRDLLEHVRKL